MKDFNLSLQKTSNMHSERAAQGIIITVGQVRGRISWWFQTYLKLNGMIMIRETVSRLALSSVAASSFFWELIGIK